MPAGERKQRKDQRAGAISRVISGNRTHQRPVPARVSAGLHDWRDGANGGGPIRCAMLYVFRSPADRARPGVDAAETAIRRYAVS
ncbi:hypothetical protein BJS_06060 [Bradyrhizobium japonicum SEMIA 5079]|nr:hypothetical protein BJS_06060 [Bradyrhizobium japonicum SEMIA 5079]